MSLFTQLCWELQSPGNHEHASSQEAGCLNHGSSTPSSTWFHEGGTSEKRSDFQKEQLQQARGQGTSLCVPAHLHKKDQPEHGDSSQKTWGRSGREPRPRFLRRSHVYRIRRLEANVKTQAQSYFKRKTATVKAGSSKELAHMAFDCEPGRWGRSSVWGAEVQVWSQTGNQAHGGGPGGVGGAWGLSQVHAGVRVRGSVPVDPRCPQTGPRDRHPESYTHVLHPGLYTRPQEEAGPPDTWLISGLGWRGPGASCQEVGER